MRPSGGLVDSERVYEKAWQLLDEGRDEDALALITSVPWEREASRERRYATLVRALLQLGRPEEARVLIRSGLEEYPASAALLVSLGNYHFEWKEYAPAREAYDRAAEHDPENRSIHANRALTRVYEGRFEEARAIYVRLAETDVDSAALLQRAAWCLLLGERPREAAREFRELIQKENAGAMVHEGLFWSYYDQGLLEQASVALVRAIRHYGSEDVELHLDLAAVYLERGRVEDAKKAVQAGLRLFPDTEQLYGILCEIEEELREPDRERKLWSGAVMRLAIKRSALRCFAKDV